MINIPSFLCYLDTCTNVELILVKMRSFSSLFLTYPYRPLAHKALSYSRCRELFLDALKEIGVQEPKAYGLHSLRSGGASHLAS